MFCVSLAATTMTGFFSARLQAPVACNKDRQTDNARAERKHATGHNRNQRHNYRSRRPRTEAISASHSTPKKFNCRGADFKYKLPNRTFYHDLRKYYFSARVVNIWNSLPNYVVDVSNTNQFKARLDKFWMHQNVRSDRNWR